MTSETDLFDGTVSTVAFGGNGIIRSQNDPQTTSTASGLVVFVPYTASGDHIRYRITEQKKNFANGEMVELIEGSPKRTSPLCQYFGVCGGCQLQHVTYNEQLAYKKEWVEDALKKQAGLPNLTVPNVIPSEQQWAYRRRISLTLKAHYRHYKVGYIGTDHHSLIEIDECPIFQYKQDRSINTTRKIISFLCPGSERDDAKVTIIKQSSHHFILHFHFKKMPKNGEEIFKKALKDFSELVGILATSPDTTFQFGQVEITIPIEELNFTFSPKAFIQNHPEQSSNIYRSICTHAKKIERGNLLDLYCGIGVSSLLLAKQGFNVTGTEASGPAIQLAKINAKQNKVSNIRFVKGDVATVLKAQLEKEKPIAAIVNPPREGLSKHVVETILNSPPATLIYVSCMPPTLARDLKLLCLKTYDVHHIELYDMFPQTAHVETLIVLRSKKT